MCLSICITDVGLAQSTSEGGLKTAFSRFGGVSRVKIIMDKKTKQPVGFAYVWFTREEFAQTAVEEMNGKDPIPVKSATKPAPEPVAFVGSTARQSEIKIVVDLSQAIKSARVLE
ncbi:RNA-binding motif, Y chromosome, family 1 member A1-like isoform X2 [Olea europaea subsp. europaea]|uniref:RNA-binding motif, Y chromosome, family 1 member A1-like isoform X2 n=1 Tax=Olea europaea subsp. europaea TaxID=158383 RepID=A0A8S0RHT4_OLEEU|nr:RNA-binding motif, Y chromosome, family 1 member A1-like isoform X2 [Olea europaea subsp. europaea]